MIRTNLSTRPFYNEHAVHVWLIVAAGIVAAATIVNVSRVIRYSRSDTQLGLQASRDEARAADLRRQASQLRGSVDPRQFEFASSEARQANDLIDRRTFSWTALFNLFETTLPDEVRITAVRPKLDRKTGVVVSINIVARGTEDVAQFMENLEATGAFTNVRPVEERFNEQGQLEGLLDAGYAPAVSRTDAAQPVAAKPAGRGGAAKR